MPDTNSSNFGPKDQPTHDSPLDSANDAAQSLAERVQGAAIEADDKAASTNAEYNGDPRGESNATHDDPPLHTPSYGPGAHGDTHGSSDDAHGDDSARHGQ